MCFLNNEIKCDHGWSAWCCWEVASRFDVFRFLIQVSVETSVMWDLLTMKVEKKLTEEAIKHPLESVYYNLKITESFYAH